MYPPDTQPHPAPTVLVIDDDEAVRAFLKHTLESAGYRVTLAEDAASGLEMAAERPEAIVLDVVLPDRRGTDILPDLKRLAPRVPVILLTGQPTTQTALQSMTSGAYDFLGKSDIMDRLLPTVATALAEASDQAGDIPEFRRIIGSSPAMAEALRSARLALPSQVPVLIQGESGTGKELLARALHHAGPRGAGPFVAVHCGGVSDDQLEADLFGRGHGTLAGDGRIVLGRIELASGGTLYLDEIGETRPGLQAKLLEILPDGSTSGTDRDDSARADVRLIAGTRLDLQREVRAGSFRDDLYYRIAMLTITLPPLRDRGDDIDLLADHFARRAGKSEDKVIDGVHPLARALLRGYRFPGNVAQLEQIIASAAVAARSSRIAVGDLPQGFLQAALTERADAAAQRTGPHYSEADFPTLQDLERGHLRSALDLAGGNKAKAARLLGISRMTLYRKLRESGV